MPGIKPAGVIGAQNRIGERIDLGSEAAAEYRRAGWRITEHGHIDAGTHVGPCARCREPHNRYGPGGTPLCPNCTPEGITQS